MRRDEQHRLYEEGNIEAARAYSRTDECLMSEDIINIMDICQATGNAHLLWLKRLLGNHFEGIIANATYDVQTH